MSAAEWLGIALLIAYFASVGTTDVWLLRRAAKRLKQKHPQAWAALGIKSPHTWTFLSFAWNKAYLELNDQELTAIFDFKKRFDTITGLIFVASAIAIGFWLKGSYPK